MSETKLFSLIICNRITRGFLSYYTKNMNKERSTGK
ncbi:unnamed protein product [Brugia timori]|uniref:Uncharacterized protein n=1 Tax=Brugia timori TaxID=42155 RepID=A0A3P7WY04_9BILA|nr:unnamed protein product [Brugia timori]